MRVFSMNSRVVNDVVTTQSVNCQLDVSELQQILLGVKKLPKSDNVCVQSVRENLCLTLESYVK